MSLRESLLAKDSAMNAEKKVFYLNLTILDAKTAVYTGVQKKIEAKANVAPNFIQKRVANTLATVASKAVKPAKIAETLSTKLAKILPFAMKEKGLTLAAEVAFIEKAYIVWEMQIQHADIDILMEEAKKKKDGKADSDELDLEGITDAELDKLIAGQDKRLLEKKASLSKEKDVTNSSYSSSFLSGVQPFFEFLFGGREKLQDDRLPKLIQSQMTNTMDKMMKKKFDEKGMVADVVANEEKDQARYFYEHLKKVRSNEIDAKEDSTN